MAKAVIGRCPRGHRIIGDDREMPHAPAPLSLASPAVVEMAAERVAWVAVGGAAGFPLVLGLQAVLRPGSDGLGTVERLALVATVLGGIGLFAAHRARALPPSAVLRAGLAFESLAALTLGLAETRDHGAPGAVGMSMVGPWILLVAALVPAPGAAARWSAMAAATMWPLAYAVNASLGSAVLLAPLAVWPIANYAMAWLASRVANVDPGTRLGGATARTEDLGGYRLLTRLGEGGMGEVWKAAHKMLARAAAVKIIRPEIVAAVGREADMAAARFRREATLIAKLQSPHTVYLYDFGVSADGRFYYAMELLDGITLEALVARFGALPDARVVAILRQVCDSLHEAHEHGIVHRDLKPSNVMLCHLALEHDFVKVLDFGLAKMVGDANATQLTMAGAATGTPGYIAPEIALGEGRVDRRADIYALGCLAYFLLSGRPVFDEANPTKLALAHVREEPTPVSARAGRHVSSELERLVMQCLRKSPTDRPQSMAEVAERLDALPGGAPWTRADARAWWNANLRRTPVNTRSHRD